MNIPTDQILQGDCRKLLADLPDACVDFVIADPPYAKEYLYLYEWMATEVPRVMKEGASLITLTGHNTIPQILDYFEGNLKFRWMNCMWQPGRHRKLSMGIEVCWKPALWFVKGNFPNLKQRARGFVSDAVEVPPAGAGVKKSNHEWEQSHEWSDYYIRRLTDPGELVFDPTCGSGTFLISAKRLDRRYLGYEISEKSAELARQRLSKTILPPPSQTKS